MTVQKSGAVTSCKNQNLKQRDNKRKVTQAREIRSKLLPCQTAVDQTDVQVSVGDTKRH